LLFVTPLIADAQLSPVEKKVVAYIDEHLPETIELLKKTTDINSGTLHVEGVKKVGEIYGKGTGKSRIQNNMGLIARLPPQSGTSGGNKNRKQGEESFYHRTPGYSF